MRVWKWIDPLTGECVEVYAANEEHAAEQLREMYPFSGWYFPDPIESD
jgi:hypothetical protein